MKLLPTSRSNTFISRHSLSLYVLSLSLSLSFFLFMYYLFLSLSFFLFMYYLFLSLCLSFSLSLILFLFYFSSYSFSISSNLFLWSLSFKRHWQLFTCCSFYVSLSRFCSCNPSLLLFNTHSFLLTFPLIVYCSS